MTETAIPTTGDRSLADLKDVDPYPFFADVQARGRVVRDETIDAWLVSGYADSDYVMRNEDLFAGPWATMNLSEIFGTRTLFGLGGDPQRVLYTEILNFFSPRVVRQYRGEFIRPAGLPAAERRLHPGGLTGAGPVEARTTMVGVTTVCAAGSSRTSRPMRSRPIS